MTLNETFKYTYKNADGSYYCYRGECGRSPHICWDLSEATYYDDPGGVKFWAGLPDGAEIIKVKIVYSEVPNS